MTQENVNTVKGLKCLHITYVYLLSIQLILTIYTSMNLCLITCLQSKWCLFLNYVNSTFSCDFMTYYVSQWNVSTNRIGSIKTKLTLWKDSMKMSHFKNCSQQWHTTSHPLGKEVLVRMWRNWNSHALLVGM